MASTRKITNSEELKEAVKELERKVENQQNDIKYQFTEVKENLQPKRIVKGTLSFLSQTPEVQKTVVNTVLGFILGYASKRAMKLMRENPLDRTVHNLVNYEVTKLEYKQPDSLLSKGISLLRKHTPPDSPIYPFVRYK